MPMELVNISFSLDTGGEGGRLLRISMELENSSLSSDFSGGDGVTKEDVTHLVFRMF
jgi:hypothetical protein